MNITERDWETCIKPCANVLTLYRGPFSESIYNRMLWIQCFTYMYIVYSGMMTSSNGNFSALLAICAGNLPVPTHRPVTRSFNVFFDLRPNERLSEQWWGWWFETQLYPSWLHCNVVMGLVIVRLYAIHCHKRPWCIGSRQCLVSYIPR